MGTIREGSRRDFRLKEGKATGQIIGYLRIAEL
jgi:hypothetical protein